MSLRVVRMTRWVLIGMAGVLPEDARHEE